MATSEPGAGKHSRSMAGDCLLALLTVLIAAPVSALDRLSESEMSSISGNDGLFVQFEAEGVGNELTATEIRWTNDAGTANEGALAMRDIVLSAPGTYPVSVALDVGESGGTAEMRLEALWDELGLEINDLRLRDSSGTLSPQSGGQIGFFSSGGLTIVNEDGILNSGSTNAEFDLRFSTGSEAGDFIIRHGPAGSPEFSFGSANMRLNTLNCDTGDCTLGLDANGLFLTADEVNLDLNFDLLFKNSPSDYDRGNPADPLDIGGRGQLIKFGWTGGLEAFDLNVAPGSVAGTQGLQIDTEFDYADDFSLILGQSGVESPRAVFKSFQGLGGAVVGPEFSLPLTLDVVPASASLGSLCYGNTPAAACNGTGEESLSYTLDHNALAAQIRDGRVRVYNTLVDVVDPAASGDTDIIDGAPGDVNENSDGDDYETYNWSLGYTFGRLDANIALYSGYDSNYDGTLDATGLTSDVDFVINSPGYWNKIQNQDPTAGDNWETNTHFFIADTDINGDGSNVQFGIGVMNADLVWQANNMAIRIASDSDTAFSALSAAPDIPAGGIGFDGGFWLESADGVRYQFRGMLGGGYMDALDDLVQIAILDVRLDTDRFVFALSPFDPPVGEPEAMQFEALLDLNANSYVSLAEPSDPGAEVRLENVTGRIMWRNGKVQIRSSADNPGGRASLTIANNILFGSTANSGDPLIGTVSFGGESFGRAVIPGGRWYSNISLKPQ